MLWLVLSPGPVHRTLRTATPSKIWQILSSLDNSPVYSEFPVYFCRRRSLLRLTSALAFLVLNYLLYFVQWFIQRKRPHLSRSGISLFPMSHLNPLTLYLPLRQLLVHTISPHIPASKIASAMLQSVRFIVSFTFSQNWLAQTWQPRLHPSDCLCFNWWKFVEEQYK